MKIIYSPKFEKKYKKLPANIKNIAIKQEALFRKNPFNSKLKTHKLKGKLKEFLSFSVDHRYRIIFEFTKNREMAYFHSIGNHDIYE